MDFGGRGDQGCLGVPVRAGVLAYGWTCAQNPGARPVVVAAGGFQINR